MTNKILVTGATGNIGRNIVRLLKDKGADFVAGTSGKAIDGVDSVSINFADVASLEKAMQGISTLFMVLPNHPDMIQWGENTIGAAKKRGVRHIVSSISQALKRVGTWHKGEIDRMRMPIILFACAMLLGLSSPAFGDWEFETIDSAGLVGGYVNLLFDSQGNQHVAYQDYGTDDVKYAYWDGTSWQIEVVDSQGDVGSSLSLALDADDHPHIAYYEDTGTSTGHLKYAHWDGSAWAIETVDTSQDCGQDNAIDIDSNGYPHISYVDNANVHLRYARWDGSTWQLETVDNGSFVGLYGDMVLDAADQAHICYRNNATGDLKYAEWDGTAWQIETVDSEGSVGAFTSIALDADEYSHISYYDWPDSLKYARWNGSTWVIETVDGGGRHTSLALDDNGYPHISHQELSITALKYARWDGSSWQLETVDNSGNVGVSTALALDSLSLPHIAYRDLDNGDLDYAWFSEAGFSHENKARIPRAFSLSQNYPNPFNPTTTIRYGLSEGSRVTIRIYDILGREVVTLANGYQPAGYHSIVWDGKDAAGKSVASGIYIYQLVAGAYVKAHKMLFTR